MKIKHNKRDKEIIESIKNKDICFILTTDLSYKFFDKTQIIHQACFYGHFDLVLYLLGKDVNIECVGGRYDSTPLFYTIYNCNVDITYFLLELGANVHTKNNVDMSILHFCVKYDNILAFILLLHYKADLNAKYKKITVRDYILTHKKYRFIEVLKRLNKEEQVISQDKMRLKCKFTKYTYAQIQYSYKPAMILLTTAILHALSYMWHNICLIPILFLFLRYRILLTRNRYFFITNIIYSLLYIQNLVYMDYFLGIFCAIYLVIFYKVAFYKLTKNQNTFNMSKDIIVKLVKAQKYNLTNFCYICWIEKDSETYHCHICKQCVNNLDHHCNFLNKCINNENNNLFIAYLLILTILLLFQKNLTISENKKVSYKFVTLFVVIQLLNRISIIRKEM